MKVSLVEQPACKDFRARVLGGIKQHAEQEQVLNDHRPVTFSRTATDDAMNENLGPTAL